VLKKVHKKKNPRKSPFLQNLTRVFSILNQIPGDGCASAGILQASTLAKSFQYSLLITIWNIYMYSTGGSIWLIHYMGYLNTCTALGCRRIAQHDFNMGRESHHITPIPSETMHWPTNSRIVKDSVFLAVVQCNCPPPPQLTCQLILRKPLSHSVPILFSVYGR